MTLQLPVEGGHEGGRVVVRHKRDENLFDLAEWVIAAFIWLHPTPTVRRKLGGCIRGQSVSVMFEP